MKNKFTLFLLMLSCICSISFSQTPQKTARVLVIISNNMMMNACSQCSSPWNWYNNNYLTLFDKWNTAYANSGMDYRVEIAGVIWDKTYNDQVPGTTSLANISNPNHPHLGKYHGMLNAFAADYLVLHSFQSPLDGAGGYAYQEIPSIGNPAVFWIMTPAEFAWVHEAGHKHGLDHCDGYRQTYNSSGQFVTSGAVWGFHTIMQAGFGTDGSFAPCLASNVGDRSISVPVTFEFANPNSTYNHAGSIPLGNSRHIQTVSSHISADQTIRSLFMTQTTVNLTSEMNVDNLEYANIIAINKVILRPGFKVSKGRLKIAVGPQVMAKRGVPEVEQFIRNDKSERIEGLKELVFKKGRSLGWYEIQFTGSSTGKISLVIYNMLGKSVKAFENIAYEGNGKPITVDLGHENKGVHILSLVSGKYKYFKQVSL